MSIVIRLQNLPLSAKSGDVRSFFGGLRIPNGGVHILGGEKGDAFIAFTSDEDARLAMRKDGEKIKDARIKLFLSSHLEMKYEVERITKCNFVDTSSQKLFSSPERIPEDQAARHKLSERTDRRKFSRSRSPHKYDSDNDKFRNHYHQRSKSPGGDIFDSLEALPSRYRSSSPRRRSRSDSPHRSQSPKSRSNFQRQRPVSPIQSSFLSVCHVDVKQKRNDTPHSDWIKPEYYNKSGIEPSRQSEIQAELERRITEALEKNPFTNARSIGENQETIALAPDVRKVEQMYFSEEFRESFPSRNTPGNFMQSDFLFSSLSPSLNNDTLQFQDSEFHQNLVMDRNPQTIPSSVSHLEMFASNELGQQRITNFFIMMSGMDPAWDCRKVQIMLKGLYAPLNSIRWEKDDSGYKTGTAVVKLSNKEDFDRMMSKATFMFNGRRITVSECPYFLSCKYFQDDSSFQSMHNMPQKCDFCFILKGLPFSCTYDDIINFFHGFEIADIVIIYGKHGRASGTGFVSFTNWKDFEDAKVQNGKKIGHRYIEMLPCSENDMLEAKKINKSSVPPFIRPEKKLSSRRPLCALITGLPFYTNVKKLSTFFSESGLKPDAIHITLSSKRQCDGRTFVEFINFRDFDLALKLHGSKFLNNIICVKQILYDEMTKILETQKVKHHFEVQAPVTPLSDVPEKVPYLWEPPDAAEEQERVNVDSTDIQLGDHTFEPTFSSKNHSSNYGSIKMQKDFRYSTMQNSSQFPSSERRNFDAYYNQESSHKSLKTENDIAESKFMLNVFDTTIGKTAEDFAKESVKLNINSNKVNIKADQAFDPFISVEEKVRLTKLSPDKDLLALNSFQSKNASAIKIKGVDFKSKSPEKRGRHPYPERSLERERKYSRDEKYKYSSRNDSFSRTRTEKDSRWSNNEKVESQHRSPVRSNPVYSERERRLHEDKSKECTVQISNVNQDVGTQDVIDFLKGFAYFKGSIVRRYTSEGEPTGDVRVTFSNRREAEMAVRTLNRCHLRDVRVSMFIA